MRLLCRSFLVLTALFSQCCVAEDGYADPGVRISGFGTVGLRYQDRGDLSYVRDLSQRGDGDRLSFRPDTRIGVQVSKVFSPQWSVVGQVVARGQLNEDFDRAISRAFISYRPNDAWHLRLGRLADATFLMSDYAEVGYVYPWVRPPVESYAIIAPASYDGVDATYSWQAGNSTWRLKALLGRIDVEAPSPAGDNRIAADRMKGLALIQEQGPWKLRVGYIDLQLKHASVAAPLLTPQLAQVSGNAFLPAAIRNEATSLAAYLDVEGARVSYASLGANYDDGVWIAQAEISDMGADRKIVARQQGHLSIGRRWGAWLPYVMYSTSRAKNKLDSVADWRALGSDGLRLQAGALRAANALYSHQDTASVGVRWDFAEQAAVKVQWDRVRVRNSGWGLWYGSGSVDVPSSDTTNVVSATLDFVF